jgi:hypothetical protein
MEIFEPQNPLATNYEALIIAVPYFETGHTRAETFNMRIWNFSLQKLLFF